MGDPGWLLVVEKGELWTASLRGHVDRLPKNQRPRLHRVTTAPAVERIDKDSAIVLAVELPREKTLATLRLLQSYRRLPNVTTVALLNRESAKNPALHLAAVEAGAVTTVATPRQCSRLARLAVRSLALTGLSLQSELPPSSAAVNRLPWQQAPWAIG